MRQLITNDIFKMSRILKKLEIKIEADTSKEDKFWDENLAMGIIKKIAENAYLAQNEINDFLGDLAGMTGEEFGKLPLKETLNIIKEFKELDGISDFFKYAAQAAK
jgi:hypothetical protein